VPARPEGFFTVVGVITAPAGISESARPLLRSGSGARLLGLPQIQTRRAGGPRVYWTEAGSTTDVDAARARPVSASALLPAANGPITELADATTIVAVECRTIETARVMPVPSDGRLCRCEHRGDDCCWSKHQLYLQPDHGRFRVLSNNRSVPGMFLVSAGG
jgi:hypothetical protein